MSAVTPDYILGAIARNAHGVGDGPMVTIDEWRKYALDLDGWFMWNGQRIDMKLRRIGGGLYRIQGKVR